MRHALKPLMIFGLFMLMLGTLSGAYLRFQPVQLTQPDGSKPELYASGDEFYNWLHDRNGFTVKQNDAGWYVYLDKDSRGDLSFTNWIAGRDNPAARGLKPWTNISPDKMRALRQKANAQLKEIGNGRTPTTGTLNNIAVFIRFSDQSEYTQSISTYDAMFNGSTGNTMQNYFAEASYGALNVSTTYYPAPGTTVISWQDSHPRAYYSPYSTSNTIGYNGDTERTDREFTLLVNAVNGISSQVPAGLNLDGDSDGMVDNVCFVIQGSTDGWSELLWPHRWSIYDRSVYINGKRVYDYNFQLSTFLASSGVGVLCHEMFHSLGAPDLYHYSYDGLSTVGSWDLMESTQNPPQHMGAFMKYKYGHWISTLPLLEADGSYTLNPLTSSTNNCYKIASPNSTTEYFVVEYRRDTGTFESSIPGSGMLVYRINTVVGEGNADGPPDEVYIYRPNGTTTATGSISTANYSQETGRTLLVSTSNPTPFLTDGSAGGIKISGVGSAGATISFILGNPIPGAPSCSIDSPATGSYYDTGSQVAISVSASDADGSIASVAFYVNNSLLYTDTSAPYSWVWNTSGYSGGAYTIKVIATDNSAIQAERSITLTLVEPADEGFETGDFSLYPWNNGSAIPWTVVSSEHYSGSFCAKSGPIGDSSSTSLSLALNITSSGSITFFQKVSSESGWDFLTFYLDGVQQAQWSGSGSWALQSYPVTTGAHTFTWTYSKDTNTAAGSDCAWIDHIVFPPCSVYYAPPQNLLASPGNGHVDLSWQAPAAGTPTGYKLFRDGSLLTTATGLSYSDTAVVNGSTYSYYLTAVYSGGESDPTSTVQATPNAITHVILGTGTSATTTNTLSPLNNSYKSIHGQSVYTQAELNAAGIFGPIYISRLGFYPVAAPNLALPNFMIRIKHTTATSASAWINGTDMQTVYSNAAYMPTTGNFDMLDFSTPFLWNGTDNIVVDTAFGMLASFSNSGTLMTTSLSNGYIRVGSDTVNQTNVFSGGSTRTWRPNVKMGFTELVLATPQVSQVNASGSGTVLQWAAIPYATSYRIYRATEAYGSYSQIGSTTGLQYTDTETLPKAFYYVKAVAGSTP